MNPIIQSVYDLQDSSTVLRQRRYGMIECRDGEFVRVQLRPWPKISSIVEARWMVAWKNRWRKHDVCRLYYNQPLMHRNYLALSLIESTRQTRLKTVMAALRVLDTIASIKTTDAILAEVTNSVISDRVLKRFGWQPHLERSRGRHWIKRFYGNYPK